MLDILIMFYTDYKFIPVVPVVASVVIASVVTVPTNNM
jgi:hypothetical protein